MSIWSRMRHSHWGTVLTYVSKINSTNPAFLNGGRGCCSDETDDPVPPGADECCQTGCQNCVWIKYAEQLVEKYNEKGLEKALKLIQTEVDDPTVREFIKMDLEMKLEK